MLTHRELCDNATLHTDSKFSESKKVAGSLWALVPNIAEAKGRWL